jgi:hypothetical protein
LICKHHHIQILVSSELQYLWNWSANGIKQLIRHSYYSNPICWKQSCVDKQNIIHRHF